MLYLYDNAIVKDIYKSFNSDNMQNPVVSVVPPEDIISIAAQVQDDKLHFPMVAVARETNIPVDSALSNFTRLHSGVPTTFDAENNIIYHEKSIPIKLTYNLVCMGTNTADVDELIKELMFKYASQYFLTLKIPYESKRHIRFGIRIDPESEIEWYSTSSNYLQEGKLHSAGIKLNVDGAVLLSYTPIKLRRVAHDIEVEPNSYAKIEK